MTMTNRLYGEALSDLRSLRAEVARIAATCDAIASIPSENERAVRCLSAVGTSLRNALGCTCDMPHGPTVCDWCRGRC